MVVTFVVERLSSSLDAAEAYALEMRSESLSHVPFLSDLDF